jgi:NAD(P)-dependent dehydrogenase (short-subunit alcohol dehydrogenase family)
MDFTGRVALVTGAASGIGRAAALMLAARGARAVVGLDRDADGLAELSGALRHPGVALDVTDAAAVTRALAEVREALGGVDLLVTAAGVLQPPPLAPEAVTERQFDKIVDVHLKATWRVATLVGADMAARGRGAIVTVASITGIEAGPLVAYGPAKAAVIQLTRSLAGAWGAKGVRVNAVAPGFTATPGLKRGMAFGVLDEGRLARSSAMGRLVEADEVAEAVCFLLSDAASGITGAVLPVDAGGLVASGFAPFAKGTA